MKDAATKFLEPNGRYSGIILNEDISMLINKRNPIQRIGLPPPRVSYHRKLKIPIIMN